MIEVNVRELKSRLAHYLRKLEEGEQIKITRRGKTVGTIVPPAEEDRLSEKMRELYERGVLAQWSDKKPAFPRRGVKMRGSGPTIAEMIIEDRG
jgi:prevent-host-death family protein